MSAWAIFLIACVCTGVLALTCTVIAWAVKNILTWVADDITDSLDTIKYTHDKRKRAKEAHNK